MIKCELHCLTVGGWFKGESYEELMDKEVRQWCENNISGDDYTVTKPYKTFIYHFFNQEDFNLFKLIFGQEYTIRII